MRRLKHIEQRPPNQEGAQNGMDDDILVLRVIGVEAKPFVLKDKINQQQFSNMIASGFRITIFTKESLS